MEGGKGIDESQLEGETESRADSGVVVRDDARLGSGIVIRAGIVLNSVSVGLVDERFKVRIQGFKDQAGVFFDVVVAHDTGRFGLIAADGTKRFVVGPEQADGNAGALGTLGFGI